MEKAELQNFFEEPSEARERWVILNDPHQQLPEFVWITGAEKRQKIQRDEKGNPVFDADGKTIPVGAAFKVLLLRDAQNAPYVMCAWERDVEKCIKQWGKNPLTWERCRFVLTKGRWALFPTTNNHTEEVIA